MIISLARPEDIPQLTTLLSCLFAQEVEFVPDADAQVRGLLQVISNPAFGHVLVAKEQSRIVGMVNLLYTVSTALGSRVCLLEDMVVLPECRGRNVGSELLQQAIVHASQQGCQRITLLTDADNVKGQQFYRRAGFERSSMLPMWLALPVS